MTIYGADVEALEALAASMRRRSTELAALATALGQALTDSRWIGPDADEFRASWNGRLARSLDRCVIALTDGARTLDANAHDQRRASSAGGSTRAAAPSAPSVSAPQTPLGKTVGSASESARTIDLPSPGKSVGGGG